MPFINSKMNFSISEQQKDLIKEKLGKIIPLLGKSESWLMVGFEPEQRLYFKGDSAHKMAYVEIKLYGKADRTAYQKMTASVCDILESELDISSDHIYVVYQEIDNWGWNGDNF